MSKIQKVAVTDARLIQDEPVYAVQKGALSVSVAPFQAISASQSQMTFQILVPSLNVFIDRKIVLSTQMSFNASLFYSGPRQSSSKTVVTGTAAVTAAGVSTLVTATAFLTGAALSGAAQTTIVAALNAQVTARNNPVLVVQGCAPGTIITNVVSGVAGVLTFTFSPPTVAAIPATTALMVLSPLNFDVPDLQQSVSCGTGLQIGLDNGQALAGGGQGGGPSGWCSAVSGKDLAWTQFPVQSSLANMTCTLNDCTVTTNGDTLREQLMLTSTRDTLKQRTTPTNADTFSWGRDDAQNASGNFSTYAVTNQYGDVPNGAWPTVWSSDASCATQIQSTGASAVAVSSAVWPFIASSNSIYRFLPDLAVSGAAQKGGVGFYVATSSTAINMVTGFASGSSVLVPFLNYQPVWTTGFPGGDLYGGLTTATATYSAAQGVQSFSVLGAVLTLNVSVPPMCMVGARVYDAVAGNTSITAAALPTATAASGVSGIVTSLLTGGLGQIGSTYQITYATGVVNFTGVLLGAQGTPGATQNIIGLSAGCPVQLPLPVFGTIAVAEPMVISPLIWADSAEFQSVGLYGMTNMQFVLNFSSLGTTRALVNSNVTLTARDTASFPLFIDDLSIPNPNTGNVLRSSNLRTCVSDVKFAATGQQGPWAGGGGALISATTTTVPTLYATFLTPGVDVTIPDVSTVPYCEFPRYFYSTGAAFTNFASPEIQSQTISLTSIPDMVMVYVKPATRGPSQLDQYLPIKKVSVTFDNFSNLCSSYQQCNLYESAVAAGLDMDWHQWRGYTQAQYPSAIIEATNKGYTQQSGFTQLSGGPILLRMGQDITLQPGLAPGCLGNYSFQITVLVDNSKGYYNYVQQPIITIVAINTGFFETMRGQSAIRKTILQMADVAAATSDSGFSKSQLNRMVGRGNYFSGASNMIQRGLSAAKAAKDINDRYKLTDLARTYGGQRGSQLADMADSALSSGAQMNDSLYGSGKRHRSSGL